ncbi:uncharacterized protein LOC116194712 isoform X2 [Punica granatum]|uniref:Uncharacterized protein LOC116194712 isoform X2 n=1 Tax=Punica granatum TaxID=22663 RepID=A0A6P8C7D4_PUNGR|nr:uncharacterized protein LOC116194712 isoform X2 [Punica granatum]
MARFISPTNFATTLSACAQCSPYATTRFQISPSIFLAMASPKSDREEYRESFEILQLQMGSTGHRVVAKFSGLMNLAVSFNVGGSIVLTQNPAFHCQQVAEMIILWIVVLSVGAAFPCTLPIRRLLLLMLMRNPSCTDSINRKRSKPKSKFLHHRSRWHRGERVRRHGSGTQVPLNQLQFLGV